MKRWLALLIFTAQTATASSEEIKAPPVTKQANEACLHGQLQSYKLIPLDTKSQFISPEVWEAYNRIITEHIEKKDIVYPEKGQQLHPLSCHHLMIEALSTMDLDY